MSLFVKSIGTAGAAILTLACVPAYAQSDDDWSGIYVGVHGDGTIDTVRSDSTVLVTQISGLFVTGRGLVIVPGTTLPQSSSDHSTNFDAGGHAGYQKQFGGFVIGAEGDFDPLHRNVDTQQSQMLPPTALTPATKILSQRNMRLGDQWSIRARAGVAFGKTLAYVTGGYAATRGSLTSIETFTNPGGLAAACSPAPCQANLGPEGPVLTSGSGHSNFSGWTGGGGIEERLGRHLSLALEYRHTAFGSKLVTVATGAAVNTGPVTVGDNGAPGTLGQAMTAGSRIGLHSDSLGLRLNWRF